MKNDLKAAVGMNIRRFRRRAGLTIEELAFRCGLHHNYLGDIERGRRNPSLANLAKIAAGLCVPLRSLFPKADVSAEAPRCDLYSELRPLVRDLRDASPLNREHVISMAQSLARRLKGQR